ncbi:MAG: LptA/OstA family protein [Nevskiaceae bacterium]
MSPRASACVLAAAVLALLATAAASQGSATPTKPGGALSTRLRGPIKITAERAELERREYALYRGRVRLESNDMVMTGDRLELRQPDRGQFEARLTGTPAHLDHPGNDKAPAVTASAQQIVYDTRTATVDLSGGVQLARGTDVLNSGQVRYNVAARRISAAGDGASQVQITITPPQNEEPAPKPNKRKR